MFDDKPVNQTGAAGQPPANLPIADAEDIFSAVPEADPVGPEDAPATPSQDETPMQPPPAQAAPAPAAPPAAPQMPPSALAAGVLQPAANPFPPSESAVPQAAPPQAPPPAQTMPKEYVLKEPTMSRGIMTMIIIAVVVLILGAAGWFIYRLLRVPDSENQAVLREDNTAVLEEETEEPVAAPPSAQQPENAEDQLLDDRILFGEPIDTDADGLADDEEATHGTDPQNWDSDGDSLNDGDEVLVWQTDPMNPDTDGDTYLDGEEVKAGYNPSGPGRFTAPPQPEQQSVAEPAHRATEESSEALGNTVEAHLATLANTTCPPEKLDAIVVATADIFVLQGLAIPDGLAENPGRIRERTLWAHDMSLYASFLSEVVTQLSTCQP